MTGLNVSLDEVGRTLDWTRAATGRYAPPSITCPPLLLSPPLSLPLDTLCPTASFHVDPPFCAHPTCLQLTCSLRTLVHRQPAIILFRLIHRIRRLPLLPLLRLPRFPLCGLFSLLGLFRSSFQLRLAGTCWRILFRLSSGTGLVSRSRSRSGRGLGLV